LSTKLEKLISILGDNVWHNVDQVVVELEIPHSKIQPIVSFLEETDIIQHNPATNQIKLNQNWKNLLVDHQNPNLEETDAKEENLAIGTIILPPRQPLLIQSTRITNLTDSNLELELRLDSKIKEIAINKV
jgi:hypothetical protein